MRTMLVAKIENQYKVLILSDDILKVKDFFRTNRPRIIPKTTHEKTIRDFKFGNEVFKLPATVVKISGDYFDLDNCVVALSLDGKPYLIEIELSGYNGFKGRCYFEYRLHETKNGVVDLDNLKYDRIPTLEEFLKEQQINISKDTLESKAFNKDYLKKLENKFNNIEQDEMLLN